MKFVLISFSLMLCFLAKAEVLDSIKVESIDGKNYILHEVDEKETLYSISRRYKVSLKEISDFNGLEKNQIDIGQVLKIPFSKSNEIPNSEPDQPKSDQPKIEEQKPESTVEEITSVYHIVQPGETLYRISKTYNVSVDSLKMLNDLNSNNLDLGMKLLVRGNKSQNPIKEDVEEKDTSNSMDDYLKQFDVYLVQTGETLKSISDKLGNKVDSIKFWNGLDTDFLSIGQKLHYKKNDSTDLVIRSKNEQTSVQVDEKGFEKIHEEGVAGLIDDMNTKKYLALHKSLPIGSKLEVRNLMNNRVVHVKVVGRLPKTGLNKNILLRLSQPAFDQLGILDRKSRVEVSYFK